MEVCIICSQGGGSLTLLTKCGIKSIAEFAKHQDNEDIMMKCQQENDHHIHKDCQKNFTNQRRIEQDKKKLELSKKTSSLGTQNTASNFCWKSQCFFCSEKLSSKTKVKAPVKLFTFRDNIIRACETHLSTNSDDSWLMMLNRNCQHVMIGLHQVHSFIQNADYPLLKDNH